MLKWINKKRNKKGFTLVELVVVIAILGVLAAIAVPRLSGFRKNAALAADKATAATIGKAAELYSSANNLSEDDKTKLKIEELEQKELIESDIEPQDGDYEKFILEYNNNIFEVYYGDQNDGKSDKLYPEYEAVKKEATE